MSATDITCAAEAASMTRVACPYVARGLRRGDCPPNHTQRLSVGWLDVGKQTVKMAMPSLRKVRPHDETP